jgi:SnoaL-like domain
MAVCGKLPGPQRTKGIAMPFGDVVGRYQAALNDGDADAIVDTFAPDGYYREPIGPHSAHRGAAELRSFFIRCFSAGGGIGLQHCVVTDDGARSRPGSAASSMSGSKTSRPCTPNGAPAALSS